MDKKRHILQAATGYLEMRGFKIIELNWKQARHRVDIIGSLHDDVFFIYVTYLKDMTDSHTSVLSSTEMAKRLQEAAVAWSEENKYTKKIQIAELVLYGDRLDVLSFMT